MYPKDYANQKSPGKCLNSACWSHDNCYDTIGNLSQACYWSKTTKDCDDAFFSAYETCKVLNECDGQCEAVATIARRLRDTDCANDWTISWTATCNERLAGCPDCTSKSDKDSCAAIGAECGTSHNGCGGTIVCGSCPDPSTQECGFFNETFNQCRPKDTGFLITYEGGYTNKIYSGSTERGDCRLHLDASGSATFEYKKEGLTFWNTVYGTHDNGHFTIVFNASFQIEGSYNTYSMSASGSNPYASMTAWGKVK